MKKTNKMETNLSTNRISELFNNSTIFITGATGFLGKVLIEKLLRTCDGLKKIFILIRPKKGKTAEQRLNMIFENALFDLLRKEKPEIFSKCHVIRGDVGTINLSISDSDRKKLEMECNFIFHSAATTRFDDTIKTATLINTRGTKYVLELAENCQNLKAFIHVSTAYAYPKENVLEEKIYHPPADPHQVLASIDWIREDKDGIVTKILLNDCPNTYTFSKALAESLVYEKFDKIPSIITRPSVIIPIWKDPLPGWCNNLQGPMGLFVGAGKGVIRSMYMNSKSNADFIPADIAINAMLVATWHYCTYKKHRIYHLTSSQDIIVTWEEIIELGKSVLYNHIPFNGILWYPGGSMKKSRIIHNICFFLFQLIPAIFIDLLLTIFGYKPILYPIQRRIQKGGEMFEFYTTKAWKFHNNILPELRTILTNNENILYKIDKHGLDLNKYLINCMYTVRRTILKETDDMIPAAKRNMKIMWFIDYLCKIIFIIIIIYYLFTFISG